MFAYKRQEEHVSQKGMAGSFKNKIGAYSNMIEVPRIPGKEKPGVLIFGGNSDFRTDVDRQEFCKVYLWKNKVFSIIFRNILSNCLKNVLTTIILSYLKALGSF